jgi:hypothetical protein
MISGIFFLSHDPFNNLNQYPAATDINNNKPLAVISSSNGGWVLNGLAFDSDKTGNCI